MQSLKKDAIAHYDKSPTSAYEKAAKIFKEHIHNHVQEPQGRQYVSKKKGNKTFAVHSLGVNIQPVPEQGLEGRGGAIPLKSNLKKTAVVADQQLRIERKVSWPDAHGKDLAHVQEFHSSVAEEGKLEFGAVRNSCICAIL